MNTKNINKLFVGIFLAIILLFFISIMLRFGTRQVLVKKLGISNKFTDLVFFDAKNLNDANEDDEIKEDIEINKVDIDWRELYPFYDENGNIIIDEKAEENKLPISKASSKYTSIVNSLKSSIETYSTDFLVGYNKITETAGGFEKNIKWNFTSLAEYNNVIFLEDGYLSNVLSYRDPKECAYSTISLKQYCDNKGIDFLFVMEPSKICVYEDFSISGSTDFSNQVADEFLELLNNFGVNFLDTRELIHKENINHHSLFYNTDHHWKAETGLWATRKIEEKIVDEYGYNIDISLLDDDNFRFDVYEKWFLGSLGKKVTLSQAEPDDITLIYPNFETKLHYSVPNLRIDEIGDFSVSYDMNNICEIDYYHKNPYGAYNRANNLVCNIENELINKNVHILVIHHSFANCVIPFMSLNCKNVDALDLRHFTGSVQTYINNTKPDIVIVMYTPNSIGKINWESNTDLFDFR